MNCYFSPNYPQLWSRITWRKQFSGSCLHSLHNFCSLVCIYTRRIQSVQFTGPSHCCRPGKGLLCCESTPCATQLYFGATINVCVLNRSSLLPHRLRRGPGEPRARRFRRCRRQEGQVPGGPGEPCWPLCPPQPRRGPGGPSSNNTLYLVYD